MGTAVIIPDVHAEYVPKLDPLTLSGMQGWWDFSDATTLYTDAGSTLVTADNDLIYRANDKSGNSQYLEQTVVGSRPTYKTNIRNGLSIARFDGSADVIGRAVVPVATAGTYVTVCVKRSAPGGGAQDVWTRSAGGAELLTLSSWSATDWVWYKNQAGSQVALTGATATSWAILSVVHTTASSVKMYYNGTQVGSFDPDDSLTTSTAVNIGGGNFGDVDVAEMFDFNVALSASDHNRLGRLMSWKYSLPWTDVV